MIERVLCPVLVGREAELSSLEDTLLAAARGQGSLVILAGDAGLGKTRLAVELRTRAARIGCAVLWGGCSEAGLSLPYLPFLEAIGNQLATADIAQVRRRLGVHARDLAALLPQLGSETAPGGDGDPAHARLRLFEAVLALLGVVATDNPLLLVIEDVHAADASTRDLLDYLARRVRSLPIMVLATYRSDETHRRHPLLAMVQSWRRARLAEIVELRPLDIDTLARMVCATMNQAEITPEFRDYLHERSEGNPFALEEMLREAIDRGDVFRTERGWDRKSIADLRLPQAVADAILLRVERLSADEVAVLQASAVLGRTFAYPVLASITELPIPAIQAALAACVQSQLLEEDLQNRGRFRFRHGLTHKAVYEDLIPPRREELHARAATSLEAVSAPAVEVAHHLLLGGRTADAVPLCLQAADDAMARFAAADAAALYRRALPYVTDPALRGRVLCHIGEALWRSSELVASARSLEEAIELLDATGQQALSAHAHLILGRCAFESGRIQDSYDHYTAARQVLETLGPSEDLATAHLRLALHRVIEHDGDAAREHAERAIAIAEAAGADALRIWAYTYVGVAMTRQGRVEEGLRHIDRSLHEAIEHGYEWVAESALNNGAGIRNEALLKHEVPGQLAELRRLRTRSQTSEGNALTLEAELAFARADIELSLAYLDGAAEVARHTDAWAPSVAMLRATVLLAGDQRAGARTLMPDIDQLENGEDRTAAMSLAMALELADGNTAPAAAIASRVIETTAPGVFPSLSEAAVEAFIAAGRYGDAERLLGQPNQFRGPAEAPYRQRAQGRIALAAGRAAEAVDLLEKARATFATAGESWQELRTRLVLARGLAAMGDLEQARGHLLEVVTVAEAAGLWLPARLAREIAAEVSVALPAQRLREDAHMAAVPSPHHHAVESVTVVMAATVGDDTGRSTRDGVDELSGLTAFLRRWADDQVRYHHGVLMPGSGDPLLAIFELPPEADPCVHAVQAAIALCDKGALVDMPVAVGVAMQPATPERPSGSAGIPEAGAKDARRLMAAAAPGEVVLNEPAHAQVRPWLAASGMWAAPVRTAAPGVGEPAMHYAVRRRPGRATAEQVEAHLEVAERAWRAGDAMASATAAEAARVQAEQINLPALADRAVAVLRRTGARLPGTGSGGADRPGGLSDRELQVVALVAEGDTNAQIAMRLHISERTAATHVGHILTKLDLRGRAQIARWAAEHRVVVTSSPP